LWEAKRIVDSEEQCFCEMFSLLASANLKYNHCHMLLGD
jgi:hypothetical protein